MSEKTLLFLLSLCFISIIGIVLIPENSEHTEQETQSQTIYSPANSVTRNSNNLNNAHYNKQQTLTTRTATVKVSKVLKFTKGACGVKQNVPQVFWETAEDYESESVNHVAKWFCKDVKPPQKDRIATVRKLLNTFVKFLEESKIEHWIDRGTLLGSVRNQSFIPWDVDADIGMTFQNFKKLIRVTHEPSFHFPCNDCTLLLRAGKHSHIIPFKFINTTNGMYVDSFLYFRDDAKKVEQLSLFWPMIDGHTWTIPLNVVFPLQKNCTIEGNYYWCPKQAREYNKLWYGVNWTIPLVPKGWKW